MDGKRIVLPLAYPRLKKDAVPTLFLGLSSHFSKESAFREDPEEKNIRIENEHLKEDIEDSERSQKDQDKKLKFENYKDIVRWLSKSKAINSCDLIRKEEKSVFVGLGDEEVSSYIKCSVTVEKNVKATASTMCTGLKI